MQETSDQHVHVVAPTDPPTRGGPAAAADVVPDERFRGRALVWSALLLALLFTALAWDVKDHGLAWSCDHPFAKYVHDHVTRTDVDVCSWITQLGSVPVQAPLVVALGWWLLWMKRMALAFAVALAAAGSVVLGTGLKDVVQRARPVSDTFYAPRPGYSFPSGHTLGACIIFGITALVLCALTKSRRVRQMIFTTYAVLVLAVAISLLVIGVHYLTDVTGALLIGPAWLLTVWAVRTRIWPARTQPR